MNKPLTWAGLSMYQFGFQKVPANTGNVVVTTLGIRKDPGRILKDVGCAMIVLGIFLMFYMKSYFRSKKPSMALEFVAEGNTRLPVSPIAISPQ